LKSIVEKFAGKSADQRAGILVNLYFRMANEKLDRGDKVPDHLRELFTEWLRSPIESRAKEQARERMFMGMVSDIRRSGAGSADCARKS